MLKSNIEAIGKTPSKKIALGGEKVPSDTVSFTCSENRVKPQKNILFLGKYIELGMFNRLIPPIVSSEPFAKVPLILQKLPLFVKVKLYWISPVAAMKFSEAGNNSFKTVLKTALCSDAVIFEPLARFESIRFCIVVFVAISFNL